MAFYPALKNSISALLGFSGQKLDASTELDYSADTQCRLYEDFLLDAGATLPAPWGKQDTSAAGAPVTDYVADASAGTYVLALAADNEVETLTLYFADQLVIPIAKKPIVTFRFKVQSDVTGAGGVFAAGDKFVIGLASARNATLDSVATNAWFRFEGANHNILIESDDTSTDRDDKDSGFDWSEDSYILGRIDCSDLTDVKFYIKRSTDTTWLLCNTGAATTFPMSASSANLQFFCEIQKAAAANKDHKVTIDFVDVVWTR